MPILTKNQEQIGQAISFPRMPEFGPYRFPKHGDAVLRVFPTDDERKSQFIKKWAAENMFRSPNTYTIIVPINPRPNHQQYKNLGQDNAYYYISKALYSLIGNNILEYLKIGTVIAMSMESFIQSDIAPSADVDTLVWYNMTIGKVRVLSIKPVALPAEYLDNVRSSGPVDDNPGHGKATVGLIENQEQIVPAEPAPELPPFPSYQFPQHGDAVLFVICHSNLFEWTAPVVPRAGCSGFRTFGEGQRVDTVDTAAVDSPQPDPYGTASARTSEIQTSGQSESSPSTLAEPPHCALLGDRSLYRARPLHNCHYMVHTGNGSHTRIIQDWAAEQVPEPLEIYVKNVTTDTEVGAQPYNNAGQDGAYNRIRNALSSLAGSDIFQQKKIGTVIAVSVENFIRTDTGPPADFGLVVWHNATTGTTRTCCTEGVAVPAEHIEHARSLGSVGDNPDHGKVTIGSIIANMQPDINKARWQISNAHTTRCRLLSAAMEKMPNPLSTEG